MSPRNVPDSDRSPGRRPLLALSPALIAAIGLTLAGCSTISDPNITESSSTPSATSTPTDPPTSFTPTTTTAATPVTPDEQAAANADAAYRRNSIEGFRHLDTAIREAAAQGGVYVRTPELDAILQEVATDPDYNARAGEPAIVLQDAPTIIGYTGAPVITDVRIDGVEIYDQPQTINGQDGITALVRLTGCKDVTSIVDLGPDGVPLFPDATESRFLRETVTVREQPHFITGITGWYVADRTNVVEQTCDLP